MGRRGLVGLFVNKFTTMPRVDGSHPGSSSFFVGERPGSSMHLREDEKIRATTRRENAGAATEENEPAGERGV